MDDDELELLWELELNELVDDDELDDDVDDELDDEILPSQSTANSDASLVHREHQYPMLSLVEAILSFQTPMRPLRNCHIVPKSWPFPYPALSG